MPARSAADELEVFNSSKKWPSADDVQSMAHLTLHLSLASALNHKHPIYSVTHNTINSAGNVAVADKLNHRIQMFVSPGNYLVQWGNNGSGNGQFALPEDVAFDSLGNIYVEDKNNHLVQKFTFSE